MYILSLFSCVVVVEHDPNVRIAGPLLYMRYYFLSKYRAANLLDSGPSQLYFLYLKKLKHLRNYVRNYKVYLLKLTNRLVYLSIVCIIIFTLYQRLVLHFCPNSNYLIHCWGGIHHPVSVIGILWSHPSHRHCPEMTLYWFHGACLGLTTSISRWQSLQ